MNRNETPTEPDYSSITSTVHFIVHDKYVTRSFGDNFLPHLAQSVRGLTPASCVVRRVSLTVYLKIFSSETKRPRALIYGK